VLGSFDSARRDSFAEGLGGLLQGPVYTRPAEYRGWRVPDVLMTGDHDRIARWRRERALERTRVRRPDLLR
jgi:tRNA (guanine37-N1)-methyltransferase